MTHLTPPISEINHLAAALPHESVNSESPDRAARRYQHLQPGATGLGPASEFAEEIHIVAPELFRQRWG